MKWTRRIWSLAIVSMGEGDRPKFCQRCGAQNLPQAPYCSQCQAVLS